MNSNRRKRDAICSVFVWETYGVFVQQPEKVAFRRKQKGTETMS